LERRKTSECFLCASVIGNRADRRRRFVEVEKWRKEFEVDKLVEEFEYTEKDKVFEYYPQYYHKTDKVRYVWKLSRIRQLVVPECADLRNPSKQHNSPKTLKAENCEEIRLT
jgi:hypothetical protein